MRFVSRTALPYILSGIPNCVDGSVVGRDFAEILSVVVGFKLNMLT